MIHTHLQSIQNPVFSSHFSGARNEDHELSIPSVTNICLVQRIQIKYIGECEWSTPIMRDYWQLSLSQKVGCTSTAEWITCLILKDLIRLNNRVNRFLHKTWGGVGRQASPLLFRGSASISLMDQVSYINWVNTCLVLKDLIWLWLQGHKTYCRVLILFK